MRFVFFAILITLACVPTVPAEGTDAGSNEQCILSDALKKVLDSFFNAKDICAFLKALIEIVKELIKKAEAGLIDNLGQLKDLLSKLEDLLDKIKPICDKLCLNVLNEENLGPLDAVRDAINVIFTGINGDQIIDGALKPGCELLEKLSEIILGPSVTKILELIPKIPNVQELLGGLLGGLNL